MTDVITRSAERSPSSGKVKLRHVIDTDIHVYPRRAGELREYVAEPWRSRNWGPLSRGTYKSPGGRRSDSIPPDGSPAASDPDFLWKQVFEHPGVEVHYAILIEILGGVQHDPAFNAAYRAAINEWMAATWLGKYNSRGRFKGSISVSPNNPLAAAAEIEKWAGHPHFVQVLLPPWGLGVPYGSPQFDPIWQAADRHQLPVAFHVNDPGTNSWVTPVGFPRFWSEYHAVMYPLTYAAQMTSLVLDGVLERFPHLKFVFVEGGFHWAAALIDRLVSTGRYLSGELVGRRAPTREFITDRIRFTSMPVEHVPTNETLIESLALTDADKMLMFATDYPHWDADDPLRAFPKLPGDMESRIYYGNASELYGLPVEIDRADQE